MAVCSSRVSPEAMIMPVPVRPAFTLPNPWIDPPLSVAPFASVKTAFGPASAIVPSSIAIWVATVKLAWLVSVTIPPGPLGRDGIHPITWQKVSERPAPARGRYQPLVYGTPRFADAEEKIAFGSILGRASPARCFPEWAVAGAADQFSRTRPHRAPAKAQCQVEIVPHYAGE